VTDAWPDRATLEAYADGALTPEEEARVAAHLATAPADRAVVEGIVAMRGLLARAYEAPMRAPLPEGLRAALARGAVPAPRRRAWGLPAAVALAASVALAAGLGLGLGFREAPAPGLAAGPVPAGSALDRLLAGAPSGAAARLPDGAEAVLVATFPDAAARPCREIEVTGGGALTRVLACREAWEWVVELAVAEPLAAPETPDAFVPAMGAARAAFDIGLDALGAGMVLPPSEEAEMIARGWER
jgi:hypothetical protein